MSGSKFKESFVSSAFTKTVSIGDLLAGGEFGIGFVSGAMAQWFNGEGGGTKSAQKANGFQHPYPSNLAPRA